MAATATAPRTRRRPAKAPRRKAPAASRSRPGNSARTGTRRAKPRRGITPAVGFAIPAAAVGRTAVAVGGIADSGLVVRLTRSRLWIGLVGALLVGIVGLNVYSLSLNASGSKVAQRSEALARENSAMRAQLTERLSNDRIQGIAGGLGLANPEPGSIRYLEASDADAKTAAKRLLDGDISAAAVSDVAPAAEEAAAATTAAPIEAAPAPVEAVPAAPVMPADPAATTTPAVPAPEPVVP